MRKMMEFKGVHKGDVIDVSGPDADGDYLIAINESKDSYEHLYLTRATLVEMRAFIDELLGGEGVA